MSSGVFERLQENCRLAAETAHYVARFPVAARNDGPTMRRLRDGVEKRLWEVGGIMDQLALGERTAETEHMLRIARQTERLWNDIVNCFSANDDLLTEDRRAA